MKSQDRIAIGWIDPGQVDGLFALSVMSVYRERQNRVKRIVRIQAGGLLSRMRNEVVDGFLRGGDEEWLLMVDSDESFTVDDFDKLVLTAHSKLRPVVAGLYFGSFAGGPDIYPQPVPLIFRRRPDSSQYEPINDYPANTVIPVDSAGTGCLLVHRSVFEGIRDSCTNPHAGDRWCWFLDMPINGEWYGEDMWFCRLVAQQGIQIVAHTGAILRHHKDYWLNDKHHERYKFLTREDRSVLAPADEEATW